MIGVFASIEPLCVSIARFVAANDPAKIDRWIGNPRLHIGDQSTAAPGVGGVDRADRGAGAGSSGKIAPDIGPKTGVEKGVIPGGIVRLRIGALTAWFARVGETFAPGLRYLA
jgi:hypothetical protein